MGRRGSAILRSRGVFVHNPGLGKRDLSRPSETVVTLTRDGLESQKQIATSGRLRIESGGCGRKAGTIRSPIDLLVSVITSTFTLLLDLLLFEDKSAKSPSIIQTTPELSPVTAVTTASRRAAAFPNAICSAPSASAWLSPPPWRNTPSSVRNSSPASLPCSRSVRLERRSAAA